MHSSIDIHTQPLTYLIRRACAAFGMSVTMNNEQAPNLAMRTILFIIKNMPPSGETEAAFHKFWDKLIDDTLHIAQPGKNFSGYQSKHEHWHGVT